MNRSDSTLVMQQLAEPSAACSPDSTEACSGQPGAATSKPPHTHTEKGNGQGRKEETGFLARWTCEKPWRSKTGWGRWLADDIPAHQAVPNLVMQAFATGVLDATTYADYKTFASNQTGNTILLAVSALGNTEVLIVMTAISLGTFLTFAGIFGHLGHFMSPRRRAWLLLSNTFQLTALLLALLFLTVGPAHLHVGAAHEWLVLALFAGMSGAQVASARQSGSAELPTAPMTSSYVDLVSDKYLFVGVTHPQAGGRNRRLVYIAVMWLGAVLGAVVHRYAGSAAVVGLTMGLKGVAVGLVGVARGEERGARREGKEQKREKAAHGQDKEEFGEA